MAHDANDLPWMEIRRSKGDSMTIYSGDLPVFPEWAKEEVLAIVERLRQESLERSRDEKHNGALIAVCRGLRLIHELAAEGKFESTEADIVRDAMDQPWKDLSEADQKLISEWASSLSPSVPIPSSHNGPK